PRERMDELERLGRGERFDPGHGGRMKEWLALEGEKSSCRGIVAILTGAVVVAALGTGACKESAPPTSPPTVSITSPADGATVSGTVSVTAWVPANVGVT